MHVVVKVAVGMECGMEGAAHKTHCWLSSRRRSRAWQVPRPCWTLLCRDNARCTHSTCRTCESMLPILPQEPIPQYALQHRLQNEEFEDTLLTCYAWPEPKMSQRPAWW